MSKLFNPRRGVLVEQWNNENLKIICGSCRVENEKKIFCLWLKDFNSGIVFLKYKCYTCTKRLFNEPGYFQQYMDILREKYFQSKIIEKNILFIADNFYCYKDHD